MASTTTPSTNKGRRATEQAKSPKKSSGRPSLLRRLFAPPKASSILMAATPTARLRAMEKLARELEEEQEEETAPAKTEPESDVPKDPPKDKE